MNNSLDQLILEYGDAVREQYIEVIIGSSRKVLLPDNSILRNKRILGVYVQDNISDDKQTPTGNNMPPQSQLGNTYLTLLRGSDVIWESKPLTDLMPSLNDGNKQIFNQSEFDPSKSYIYISGSAAISSGDAIAIYFVYVN